LGRRVRVGAGILLTVLLVTVAACSSPSSTSSTTTSTTSGTTASTGQPSTGPVRGLSGNTLTVGGIWSTANFPAAEVGAEAYFAQINKTSYLNGIKIKFAGFVNDNQDPATALSGVRQLVNQDNIFAIVPDLSAVNPGPYLASQQILYVGGGFDFSYCSSSVTTSLWGYGYAGCLVPSNPPVMPDTYGQYYNYVKGKTGSASPTMALFSNDNASGSNSVKLATVSAKGAGFNVVYNKADVPITASDYTPYVQQLLTANHGKQPQAIGCQLTAQCIPMWTALKNAGFSGSYWTPLGGIAQLYSVMAGTVTISTFNNSPSAALTTMQAAMNAITPGTQLTGYSNVPSYFAAAMFVNAIHTVQANKQAVTPQNVRKVLSTIKWSIPGLVGPIQYPASSVAGTPYCTEFLAYAGGSTQQVYPYTCSSKTYKVTAQAEQAS
jgi:ABC-type branched-subunit amino acid transport system substrate-binding protein